MDSIHNPPNDIRYIYKWYKKAQVDYTELYIRIYISYNAWYRQVTGSTNDREAISILKKRFVIWDDYCNGKTLASLKIYVDRLVKLTNEKPLSKHSYWEGTIETVNDWRGLIEFWYQVRCMLVHGSDVPPRYVWLAYETLELFMAEIVSRMQACFTDKDLQRLEELSTLVKSDISKDGRFRRLQQKLQAKYIESPDIWQVDMQRVHR
ncbi:MAG: hypothetical protein JWO54_986 [Candidatus Saccharibacteria bacterium]|nr:hypothetical protein [Candidatus Saccharibacteria bacterium]MDB5181223.1 hypothetical protein [Candidatus Saccharibacteria bacterium]